MIVRMNKYTFVVLADGKDAFLERLQELGMVDVTVTGWEPSEEDRALMSQIERHREAAEYLAGVASAKDFKPGKPFSAGAEAFEKYEEARRETASVEADIARYEKLLAEVAPLGEFDPAKIRELAEHGVEVEFQKVGELPLRSF